MNTSTDGAVVVVVVVNTLTSASITFLPELIK